MKKRHVSPTKAAWEVRAGCLMPSQTSPKSTFPLWNSVCRYHVQTSPHSRARPLDFCLTLMVRTPPCGGARRNGPRSLGFRWHKYSAGMFWIASVLPPILVFIALQLSATPLIFLMNTRRKNKSAHPGIPDMTPLQLSSAGLSRTSNTRRPSGKKLTKDQQIALLQDQLHTTQQLFESRVNPLVLANVYLRRTDEFSVSRPIPTRTPYTMIRWKHHRTRVAILTPRPSPKRPTFPQVQNARPEDQQAWHQGVPQLIHIVLLF